jgi:hypothetical protein
MDTIDASEVPESLALLQKIDDATTKALEKKGQLVKDHLPASAVINLFFTKLLGKSIFMPSSMPGGDFLEKIMPNPHPFPNAKMIDKHFKAPPITQVLKPYPPCILSEKELEPIKISEMKLETHHRGKKVLLHVVSPPDRNDAVMAIVQDEEDTAVLLQMYQQPNEKLVPSIQNILNYTFCIVKEPFFKQSFDNPFNGPLQTQTAYYSLRIDHPSDIIGLREGDERIPEKWKEEARRERNSSERHRNEGNTSFRDKKWTIAQRS